ncbi:hypothetical protein KQX54_009986 [Cotesia glomerata]|uniref:Uncharacterized protein n=1 Tax=Cotesia glomerata TaxID=32391 RepID=A0AAV7IRI1_COTGL|nr:hypothetical protein KQX54_009986 [Cotesia glomerata]
MNPWQSHRKELYILDYLNLQTMISRHRCIMHDHTTTRWPKFLPYLYLWSLDISIVSDIDHLRKHTHPFASAPFSSCFYQVTWESPVKVVVVRFDM